MSPTSPTTISNDWPQPGEDVASAFISWTDARRQALLRELVELECRLGYGRRGKPTTSKLRAMWNRWAADGGVGRCPHCGKGLE